jgi:hypothetical protein
VRVYAVRFQLRGKSQNQVYDGIAKRKLVSVYLVMEMNKYLVANLLFQPCHVQVPVKSRTRKLESIWTGTLFIKHLSDSEPSFDAGVSICAPFSASITL